MLRTTVEKIDVVSCRLIVGGEVSRSQETSNECTSSAANVQVNANSNGLARRIRPYSIRLRYGTLVVTPATLYRPCQTTSIHNGISPPSYICQNRPEWQLTGKIGSSMPESYILHVLAKSFAASSRPISVQHDHQTLRVENSLLRWCR